MVEGPTTDLHLTSKLILTAAARTKVYSGLSYLEVIKQLLPVWLLDPSALKPRERELLAHGIVFAQEFLHEDIGLQLPGRSQFEGIAPDRLRSIHDLARSARCLREGPHCSWEHFNTSIRETIGSMAADKREVIHGLRQILGQEQGLPVPRLLFSPAY